MGIDPNKVQIVKSCLEASFKDVNPDTLQERFVFNDGAQSSQLVFSRAFLDDISENQLKTYMDTTILPTIKANLGKSIYVGKGGGLTFSSPLTIKTRPD